MIPCQLASDVMIFSFVPYHVASLPIFQVCDNWVVLVVVHRIIKMSGIYKLYLTN